MGDVWGRDCLGGIFHSEIFRELQGYAGGVDDCVEVSHLIQLLMLIVVVGMLCSSILRSSGCFRQKLGFFIYIIDSSLLFGPGISIPS